MTETIIHGYILIFSQRGQNERWFEIFILFGGRRVKEIQTGKKLIAVKNLVKYIIVADKFKPLKRHAVQWEFNFIPTDR